jgi:hypothetical protein
MELVETFASDVAYTMNTTEDDHNSRKFCQENNPPKVSDCCAIKSIRAISIAETAALMMCQNCEILLERRA